MKYNNLLKFLCVGLTISSGTFFFAGLNSRAESQLKYGMLLEKDSIMATIPVYKRQRSDSMLRLAMRLDTLYLELYECMRSKNPELPPVERVFEEYNLAHPN